MLHCVKWAFQAIREEETELASVSGAGQGEVSRVRKKFEPPPASGGTYISNF